MEETVPPGGHPANGADGCAVIAVQSAFHVLRHRGSGGHHLIELKTAVPSRAARRSLRVAGGHRCCGRKARRFPFRPRRQARRQGEQRVTGALRQAGLSVLQSSYPPPCQEPQGGKLNPRKPRDGAGPAYQPGAARSHLWKVMKKEYGSIKENHGDPEEMERATGIEPATFSLGS